MLKSKTAVPLMAKKPVNQPTKPIAVGMTLEGDGGQFNEGLIALGVGPSSIPLTMEEFEANATDGILELSGTCFAPTKLLQSNNGGNPYLSLRATSDELDVQRPFNVGVSLRDVYPSAGEPITIVVKVNSLDATRLTARLAE